jgi:hypothetical protein
VPEQSIPADTVSEKEVWHRRVASHPLFHPLFLLLLCFLAYGVLLPWLGFYADDWILLWIYQKLGAWGIWYYHITNRPFLGPLYQILMPLLGSEPWRWQLFAVIAPWLTSLSGWFLVKNIWPRRVRLAVFTSVLIAVFPGYLSHGVALNMGHRNIILAIFLLSLTFTVLSLRRPKQFWLFYLLALLIGIYNMLAMEYFLFMELMRPFVIWIVLSETNLTVRQKLGKTARHFTPFFVALCAVLYWRTFLFPYQTFNHSLSLFSAFRENWFSALMVMAKQTVVYFWMGMIRSWSQIVTVTWERINWGSLSSFIYVLVVLVTTGITFLALRAYHLPRPPADQKNKTLAIQLLELSAVPWLLGGIPFIVVGLTAGVGGYETRYLLPFLLVSCLWVAFLILVFFKRYLTQIVVLSAVVGLSAGLQFISSNGLRISGEYRREFFWNLSYRVPALEPGTLIIGNDFSTGDGSTAWTYILNWLYAPGLKTNQLPYVIIPGSQLQQFLNQETNQIEIIGAHFTMDPGKIIFLNYNNGRCPQIYNPNFPAELPSLDPRVQTYLNLATTRPIQPETGSKSVNPAAIHIGPEPPHGWCYYYEIADLARQQGDWQKVRNLGDDAIFTQGLEFKNYVELSPFIFGYALGNEWGKASELISRSIVAQQRVDNSVNTTLLAALRDYILQNTGASEGRSSFLERINEVIQ